MYKTALILSTIPSFNVFRAALAGAFKAGHLNHFLVCSGFFHERLNSRGAFYASKAFDGTNLPTGSTVTVVGAYDPAATEFDAFVDALKGPKRSSSFLRPISKIPLNSDPMPVWFEGN